MAPGLEQNGSGHAEPLSQPEAILRVAWRRKAWLVVGVMLGLGVSAAIAKALPTVYQSTAQISILRKNPDAVADSHHLSAADYIAPPTEVLKSPPIIERAIRARDLGSLGIFAGEATDLVTQIRGALAVVPTKVPSGQGNLFKLTYRGSDGEDCRVVLSAVLDSYREVLEKKHLAVTGDTIELILGEREGVRKELLAQEAAYRAFREQAPLLGKTRDGLELRQDRLNSIQAKRSANLLQKLQVEGQLRSVELALKEGRSRDGILIMLADFARQSDVGEAGVPKQSSLQEQLMPLLLEEGRLTKLHGAKHPEVVAVRERVEMARRLLLLPFTAAGVVPPDDPVRAHVELLRQKLEHLKISEELLQAVFQQEQDEARRLATYEIENEGFQTNISMNRQLYQTLLKRLNEASLIKNAGGYQVEEIEPPSAGRRVAPYLPLHLSVGAFLGLVAGLLIALWANGRATRCRNQVADVPRPALAPDSLLIHAASELPGPRRRPEPSHTP